jgi:sodium transport system permease protein
VRGIAPLYTKEIREFVRDRRVLLSAIIMPMALVMMMMVFMGAVQTFFQRSEAIRIGVLHRENGARLLDTESASKAFEVVEVPSLEEGLRLVKDKEVRLLVAFKEDVGEALRSGKPLTLDVYLDRKSIPARIALSMLEASVADLNKEHRDAVLASRQLTERDIYPLSLNPVSASGEEREFGSDTIESLLPYLLVLFTFFGAMSQAGDAVAGEKERGTLETLLVSPAGRVQIAVAKLLSMSSVCLASAASGMVGVALSALLNFGQANSLFEGGFHMSAFGLVAILGAMIPLVLMFAAILVAISAYARNQREANTYASAVSFFVIIPAVASQFIGLTDIGSQTWVGLVPVLNSAVVIRQGLANEVDWAVFGLTAGLSCVLAFLALFAVVRMFQRESVLFRV